MTNDEIIERIADLRGAVRQGQGARISVAQVAADAADLVQKAGPLSKWHVAQMHTIIHALSWNRESGATFGLMLALAGVELLLTPLDTVVEYLRPKEADHIAAFALSQIKDAARVK